MYKELLRCRSLVPKKIFNGGRGLRKDPLPLRDSDFLPCLGGEASLRERGRWEKVHFLPLTNICSSSFAWKGGIALLFYLKGEKGLDYPLFFRPSWEGGGLIIHIKRRGASSLGILKIGGSLP